MLNGICTYAVVWYVISVTKPRVVERAAGKVLSLFTAAL